MCSFEASPAIRLSFDNPVYHQTFSDIKNHIRLPELKRIAEEKLAEAIQIERENPSYRRARLSTGGIKIEGVLHKIVQVKPNEVGKLKGLITSPASQDPDAYIAFLERAAEVEAIANRQENRIVKIQGDLAEGAPLHYAATASFFPYNGEGISDYGWGCCFRATQTALSAVLGEGKLEEVPSFETLFHLFGTNDVLKKIYVDFLIVRKGVQEKEAVSTAEALFSESEFSPYQHPYGWSNPFVSQLMFHYYGLSSTMATVNGMPASLKERKIPDDLLDAKLNFPELQDLLVSHFQKEKPLPVVIDDGKFAMAIVGARQDGESLTLWFADPHIKGGANNPGTGLIYDEDRPADSFRHSPDPLAGLYTITFDKEGRQTACSVTRDEVMFSKRSYQETEFFQKPWMFTFPARDS